MDKILSPVKERLLEYLEINDISRESFYRRTGFSASNFKGVGLRSALGSDKISEVLALYPDLNPTWLITGCGEMQIPVSASGNMPVAYPAMTEMPGGSVADIYADYQAGKSVCALQAVPLYDFDPMDGLQALDRQPAPMCRIALPAEPACDGALRIAGSSLPPLFEQGDILLYRQVGKIPGELLPGKTYLLSLGDGKGDQAVLKTVRKSRNEEQVRLESPDPRLVSIDVAASEIHAALLVCGSIRYEKAE